MMHHYNLPVGVSGAAWKGSDEILPAFFRGAKSLGCEMSTGQMETSACDLFPDPFIIHTDRLGGGQGDKRDLLFLEK